MSNFHPCHFKDERGISYNCSEQFYHVGKMEVFDDRAAKRDIMSMTEPREMKERSREIAGFDQEEWRKTARSVLFEACWRKFDQNEDLADHLLYRTKEHLAEASPNNDYWGIKMAMWHQDAPYPERCRDTVKLEILAKINFH